MTDPSDIAQVWNEHRAHVVGIAYRMLGNIDDAEDVVQEAFSRLLRYQGEPIEDLRGWLVVVVSRLCLDHLRSAPVRRERSSIDAPAERSAPVPSPPAAAAQTPDPADRITLEDNIRLALVVVLERLSPAERAVFVLHDVFQFPFEAIAGIVGRTPAACRQLASRARKQVEANTGPGRFAPDPVRHIQLAQRFVEACAGGEIEALVKLLDPDAVGVADFGAGQPQGVVRGRDNVAASLVTFLGPATGLTLVAHSVNGTPGILAFRDRQLAGILELSVRDGVVFHLHAIVDREKMVLASGGPGS